MAKFKNGLEKIAVMLEPASEQVLREILGKINAHPEMEKEHAALPLSIFMEFLSAFHLGMAYAAAKYTEAVPKDIRLYGEIWEGSEPMEWLMYRASSDGRLDEISIAHICIARYGTAIQNGAIGRMCDHLPDGFGASARTCIICHAFEECHHRHWIMTEIAEGRTPTEGVTSTKNDRQHPMEQAAKKGIQEVISSLCLPIYRMQ